MAVATSNGTLCYHCGNECADDHYTLDNKTFCCAGCQGVYQILAENNLGNYYCYNSNPGQTLKPGNTHFEYLDEPRVASQLVDYADKEITVVTFYIPAIHCSSCIWLLEHLHKLNASVVHSRIDFLKKELSVTFRHEGLSLRQLAELLVSVGYEPLISLQDVVKEKKGSVNRQLIMKIAVAGFCMGNVMLFSFPEYLGLSAVEQQFKQLFSWLNLAFAIPVTFYCGRDFFVSAWAGLKNRLINLDVPLALIIAILFLRTAFEIITQTGPGFTDTLSGLVFLLLMGRWVKQRTYQHLSFERDYRSYFPVAVTVIRDNEEKPVAVSELAVGDRILIRNNEIVPADSILMKGDGFLDFSFVTGESMPVQKVLGEIIYAGGRQMGEAVEMEVVKPVSQSYLTRLWNNEAFKTPENKIRNFNDSIARYFSAVVLALAVCAALYWIKMDDTGKAWAAFTAVLIVACPCVLALSTPFTLSAVLGVFDRHRFYLKNTDMAEQLARINTLVFDKTGTITSPGSADLSFSGHLSGYNQALIASLMRNSIHPLSREIIRWLGNSAKGEITDYLETPGKGISGIVNGHEVLIGSASFVCPVPSDTMASSVVHVKIDNEYLGFFKLKQQLRTGLKDVIPALARKVSFHVISGDNNSDRPLLARLFPASTPLSFMQSPQDKLEYIRGLQATKHKVMMLGDGLNDAGALKQSDMGVAVTDDINNFSPACDAILDGAALHKLPQFIALAKDAVKTIKMSFVIAGSYNLIGIYFAVQGVLSPLTAAVLMPLSTVTIITFTTLATRFHARKNRLQ
ncbi:HAD-IC family P-type ATPase (plasmid) [Pedobacter sp. BS3]|uniref:heavy metal translocating P-type ATPase n=1 Tax=Pedobacter sp. BS3 TaxID=2567937 RepID=UPI0011ED4724|nr:heavy metal translocating P-type ATPase metal-binding domain-containing protein [Pedobacter sp. BS3]TZF85633.1 HAD-IC family P-type ATPase [Pedobacter sp. BS3]